VKRYGLIAILAFCVGIGGFLAFHDRTIESPDRKNVSGRQTGTDVQKPTRFRAHLYFADQSRRHLSAEERLVTSPDSAAERAKAVVNALIEGPRTTLGQTIPKETKLLALYVTGEGVAYVVFDRNIVEGHPGGTFSELLTVFSVVNTLALNVSEIQAVKILVEGREKKTLTGHVDIRFPFQANLLMIK